MEALVSRAEPFVILFRPDRPDETVEDRKLRALWLKSHKAALSATCRGLLTVEPDAEARAAAQEAEAMQKAFGLLLVSVGTEAEARELARSLLAA